MKSPLSFPPIWPHPNAPTYGFTAWFLGVDFAELGLSGGVWCGWANENEWGVMALDDQKIRSTIESAITQTAEGDIPHSSEIAFHMTDWLTELQRFHVFCRDPQGLNTWKNIHHFILKYLASILRNKKV